MSGKTVVVNVRTDEFDVYIGRSCPRRGLKRSPFANPFKVGKDGDRETVLDKYRTYFIELIFTHPNVRKRLKQLRGKRLGCWCAPKPCHGNVLVELIEEYTS